jgi:hypothetical protein
VNKSRLVFGALSYENDPIKIRLKKNERKFIQKLQRTRKKIKPSAIFAKKNKSSNIKTSFYILNDEPFFHLLMHFRKGFRKIIFPKYVIYHKNVTFFLFRI